jgi:hypothetical protein
MKFLLHPDAIPFLLIFLAISGSFYFVYDINRNHYSNVNDQWIIFADKCKADGFNPQKDGNERSPTFYCLDNLNIVNVYYPFQDGYIPQDLTEPYVLCNMHREREAQHGAPFLTWTDKQSFCHDINDNKFLFIKDRTNKN